MNKKKNFKDFLRTVFLKDIGLKILALICAVLLWIVLWYLSV